jgi:hypothetical protein
MTGIFAGLIVACQPAVTQPPVQPRPVAAEPVVERAEVEEVEEVAEVEEVEEPGLPWPADVPPLAGMKIIKDARISANVGDSADVGTFVAGRGELHATAAAWIASAQGRGFRVLAERFDERVHVASLIEGGGRRAYLLLEHDGEELAGVFNYGRDGQVALTGRCVEVPQRERIFEVDRGAITHGGGFRREVVEMHMPTRLGYDFDNDGELDALVPTREAAKCPGDVRWTVYLARGDCAHAVGDVGPGDLVMWTEGAGKGPRALEFEAETTVLGDGGVVRTTVTSRFEFKGSRYVRTRRTPQTGICHHCAWEACKVVR